MRAHALDLLRRSGCQGLLVGFESLDPDSLAAMNKGFNLAHGGPVAALWNAGVRWATHLGVGADGRPLIQGTIESAELSHPSLNIRRPDLHRALIKRYM